MWKQNHLQPQIHSHGILEKDEASPDSQARCTGCMLSFGPGDGDDGDDGGDDDGDDGGDDDGDDHYDGDDGDDGGLG